jgi:hypothetical protein
MSSDWDKYQEQVQREHNEWLASGHNDFGNAGSHGAKDALLAAAAGAVVGRMLSPGWSKEDVESATPDELEAHRKDIKGGQTVAWVFIVLFVLGLVILLFGH